LVGFGYFKKIEILAIDVLFDVSYRRMLIERGSSGEHIDHVGNF
jgi:hypothetical protein